jgi:hypothetical protein
MKHSLVYAIMLCLAAISFAAVAFTDPIFKKKATPFADLRDGDIVFQTSSSGQSLAVQLATHSKYTHCGIVFKENDEWIVYEAVQPVCKTKLRDWISHGDYGFCEVRRLNNADSVLTATVIEKMRSSAIQCLGRDYDIYFNWDEDRLYCSELVWKVYHNAANIDVGTLHRLCDYDLSSPVVKKIMKQRYGNHPPLDDYMISPQDVYESPLLHTVKVVE